MSLQQSRWACWTRGCERTKHFSSDNCHCCVLIALPDISAAGAARQVGVLDARLRAAALALRPALEAAADSEASDALDPVALRLQASEVRLC